MEFEAFLATLHRLVSENKTFAAYRLPDDGYLYFLKEPIESSTHFIDQPQEGFVFAPFEPGEKNYFWQGTLHRISLPQLIWKPSRKRKDNIQHYHQPDDNAMNVYLQKIEAAKAYIASGACSKIVLSREEFIPLSKSQPEEILRNLLAAYPSAFVMAVNHPDTGLWFTATPENLLSTRGHRLRTVSLAGTKQFGKDQVVSWRDKEKREQQIVTDFITEVLQKYTTHLNTEGPNSLKAGRLLHLYTELKADFDRKHLKKILDQLHPTPATCGFPKDKALDYLLQNEEYARDFYTGYAGPVQTNGDLDFYVTLRCMQIVHSQARIFVGGGITSDSLAEEEWKETMAKAETMKRVLFRLEEY